MSRIWPSLFLSHGAPTIVLDDTPAHRFLRSLGRQLGKPRAILCVSAHWETEDPALTASPAPPTVHDFGGFPEILYRMNYPASGDPALAREVAERLRGAGLSVKLDAERGLDHGVWTPLMLMMPEADVPVVQLSVQPHRGAAHHVALGRLLAELRERDVLVLGSGALTHNLADVFAHMRAGREPTTATPAPWARAFCEWIEAAIRRGDLDMLADFRRQAPHAAIAHPADEHLLPLHIAAAAGGGVGTKLHESFEYGSLAMSVYAFPGLS